MSAIARYVPPAVVSHMQSMQNRLANLREKTKAQEQIILHTVESAGVGFGLGFMEGRYDRKELGGVPMAPVAGVISHIAGFVMGGEEGDHLHAVGDAAIAVGFNNIGREFGAKRKQQAGNNSWLP